MDIIDKIGKIVRKNNSLLCVGLDSDMGKLPITFKKKRYPQFEFNKYIIKQTHDLVCAYKPNSAFYEARGDKGMQELKLTCDYLRENFSDIVIILDAKRADIESTNEGYAQYAFDWLGADAVTLYPYLGRQALTPFLERRDKGCVILCKTSNPGSGEFQDILSNNIPLYELVAKKVSLEWNKNKNCLLVVGATYEKSLGKVRKITGDDIWFLVPGVGAQGGNCGKTVFMGRNSKGTGMIINSSRSIIFAKDPRVEAKKLRDDINAYRE